MNIDELEKSTLYYLIKRCQEYLLRKEKLKPEELKTAQIVSLIAGCAGMGAALGSPFPIVGNAIGAATGAVVGSIVSASLAIYYKRNNKKLKNATAVLDELGQNDINLPKALSTLAKQVASKNFKEISEEADPKVVGKLLAKETIKGLKAQGLFKDLVNTNDSKSLPSVKIRL